MIKAFTITFNILLLILTSSISCKSKIDLEDNYSKYYIPSRALNDTVVYTYEFYYNDKLTKENYELYWFEQIGSETILNHKILNQNREPLILWRMIVNKSDSKLIENIYYDDSSRNILETKSSILEDKVFCWKGDCDSILTVKIENKYKSYKIDKVLPPKVVDSVIIEGSKYPTIGILEYINVEDYRDSTKQNTVAIKKYAKEIGKVETVIKLIGDNYYFIKLKEIDLYSNWVK